MQVWPDAPGGAYALVVATAVLAATTKGPVSAVVLMMELTRHLDGLLVPMLVCVSLATAVAALDRPALDLYQPARRRRSARREPRLHRDARFMPCSGCRSDRSIPSRSSTTKARPSAKSSRDDLLCAADALMPLEIATAIDVIEARGHVTSGGLGDRRIASCLTRRAVRSEPAQLADELPFRVRHRLHRKS